jgi:hypothetical protein
MKFLCPFALKGLCLGVALYMASPAEAATVTPLEPAASFEFGEGAINSFLSRKYSNQFTMGSGSEQVTIDVVKAYLDFEVNSASLELDMWIRYDLLGSPKLQRIKYQKGITAGQLSYTLSQARVTALLSDLLAEYQSLPTYVKTHLEAHFKSFGLSDQNLMEKIGHAVPDAGTQLDPKFPIFFGGQVTFSGSFVQDMVRFSVAPKLEVENMEINVSRGPIGSDRFKNRFTITTNFGGTIENVRIATTTGQYTKTGGPFTLAKTGTTRTSKFTYVYEPVLDSRFPTSSPAYFSATVTNGVAKYYVRGQFQHGSTSSGPLLYMERM